MLTQKIEDHLTANVRLSRKDIMISNFLGGLAWGLGSVLGATVVVAVLFGILRTINFVPIVGDFVTGVMQQIDQNRPVAPIKGR